MNQNKNQRIQSFLDLMQEYAKNDIMIAFSGGVDSGLLLAAACKQAAHTGKKVYAATIHTTLHPMEELASAQKTAEEIGAIHLILHTDELKEAHIENNPKNRCYLCKRHLFTMLKAKALEYGVTTILDGTNEDDLHEYRPGIAALQELGIMSPLAKAGMTKKDVRSMAKAYGISAADRPSAPCLATRFPYDTELSYNEMRRVENGESYLKTLGFYNVRLRVHGDIVRIEVDDTAFMELVARRKEINAYLTELGYSYITADLAGFRSGSMDEKIKLQ